SPPTGPTGVTPIGVAVSPDGGSVYVANEVGGSVSQYDVSSGGALTPKSPAAAGGVTPEQVAVGPDGRSVYATNTLGASVSQYDVGPGGALTAQSPSTVPAAPGPIGVAVT